MNSESPIADSTRSRASLDAELSDARKNHAAAVELIELWPHRAGLVARAIKSRDHFAALITQLEGQCLP